jgi:glycosyltransferase involved in cell wall biosynthesis
MWTMVKACLDLIVPDNPERVASQPVMTRRVAFVGPLPPPLHGFSNICAQMLVLLAAKSSVQVFDRAPRVDNAAVKIAAQLLLPFRYIACCIKDRNVSLYVALSGGFGQIYDWLYVIISKIFGIRVFIHHHSFAYLNAPSLLNRMFFALARKETHIVLSPGMRTALCDTYKVESNDVKIVSNAAFFDSIKSNAGAATESSSPICLGFLSNITFEKGIAEFFDVLSHLKTRGIAYQALIAGPVDSTVSATFKQLLASSSDTQYLGPVYGETKDEFYQQLDIFLFPTKYVNEAEPLVIHEALQNSVHVLACDRGVIAEMLSNGAGFVFTKDDFVAGAVELIAQFSHDRARLQKARRLSFEQSQRLGSIARAELELLLNAISGTIEVDENNASKDACDSNFF